HHQDQVEVEVAGGEEVLARVDLLAAPGGDHRRHLRLVQSREGDVALRLDGGGIAHRDQLIAPPAPPLRLCFRDLSMLNYSVPKLLLAKEVMCRWAVQCGGRARRSRPTSGGSPPSSSSARSCRSSTRRSSTSPSTPSGATSTRRSTRSSGW